MIEIDGSQGEGGGQIVRSSLSLSLLTGKPFRLTGIRAGRTHPGLKRQHLTCVEAAAALSSAEVSGATLGSSMLEFHPGPVQPGIYRFDIGTAGSCTLVAQTVLLPLAALQEPSTVTIRGGTYNTMAPPYEFFALTYLPLLRKMGFQIEAELVSPGFYPRGGGQIDLAIAPCHELQTLRLKSEPKPKAKHIVAILADLPDHIAETEISTACRKLGWKKSDTRIQRFSNCLSPGNVLLATIEFEQLTEVVTEFGKQGLPARSVANRLVRATQSFLNQKVLVGEHLADQLILPMGIVAAQRPIPRQTHPEAGSVSEFTTGPLTDHTKTHIDILATFLPIEIRQHEVAPEQVQITVAPGNVPTEAEVPATGC